ncbi:DnaJ domain-containing protein [Devosia enhydra]|uniref:DnaJ domain-containing protein n=1 Tax=Devosia enhydra TaxID=665118 RepID=A0A1K2HXQ6_9HYPH|nr:DnaJ domain-containing protein [Devosia enhydra]SFZ84280.1 DnaJ domain-containing protein [Devosia enhydra]
MAFFDPYALLGLARSASEAAIKSAYRKAVQTAHPDRGGDTDSFIAIVRAFGLLSDPDSRRLYDTTGIIDDEGVRNARADVRVILADMFDAAVQSAVASRLDLSSVNFIEQMQEAVRAGLSETRQDHKRIGSEIEGLNALRARIHRPDGEENLFVIRLDQQITAKATELAQLGRRVVLLETAVVELGNYQSETELITALETAD